MELLRSSGAGSLRRHAAWLLVVLATLIVSPYYERLNNPNENVRVWATRAIVEHGVLNIDAVSREWGWVNDKAKTAQHLYSSKAPGVSFLGVPVLFAQTKLRALFGWAPPDKHETTFWLRVFAVKLPMAIFLWAFARYVERKTRSALARDLLVIALGLGTLLYPYGGMFAGHALAAAAAFGAFMCLDPVRGDQPPTRRSTGWSLAGAGLLAGLAVILEYQAILVSVVLAIYALHRYRDRVWPFAAATLPPVIALGAYHRALFGRPWAFPYAYIENPGFIAHHRAGFHGLSLPDPTVVPTFLFSPAYGLFAFSPVLLLGFGGMIFLLLRGPRREALLVAAVCLCMFVFLAGMTNWRAGWCVGPRYIATVAPFLLLPLIELWPRLKANRWAVPAIVGLTIPSVFLNVVSGAVYPHYPEQFDNPVFDLTLPLLGAGYVPYGLGWLLGLRGLWAMAPLALLVLAALALVAGGDDPRPGRTGAQLAVALGIAAAVLAPLSAYGRAPRADETHAAASVRALWEPPRPSAAAESGR
jgi:hypothetical protein